MATKGIKLKNVTGDILLPATNADFVQITHDDVTTNVTSAIIENEQVVAEALVDLNNRVNNIYNQNMMYIGTCSTASMTAAKIVEVPNFTLETNAIVRVSFVNTNYSYTRPTLNVASTGAYNMVGKYGEMITGSMLMAGEWYVFRFDGTQWVLEETSLGDHLFVQLYICYEETYPDYVLASSYDFVNSPEDNYRFFFIYMDGSADIAYTVNLLSNVPQSELESGDYIWSDYLINGQIGNWDDVTDEIDWAKNNPITSTKYIRVRKSYFIKVYNGHWLYLDFNDNQNNDLLSNGCLLYMSWLLKDNISPELNVWVQDNVISGSQVTVGTNGTINIPYAKGSYFQTTIIAPRGGVVSGVILNDRNQSSGNITTIPINSSGVDITSISNQHYRTVMRYETPCAYFHLPWKEGRTGPGGQVLAPPQGYMMPNNSSMKARYYFFDNSYLTNKNGNAYSYSSLVLGNNYYDYNTKSLSYWNGDFMSKFITTYSGANDAIFFGAQSGRLKIKSDKIYFSLDEDVHKLYDNGTQAAILDDDYNVTEIAPDHITSYIIKTTSKLTQGSTQTGGSVWKQFNPDVFICEGRICLSDEITDSNPGVVISSKKMTNGTTSYFTGYITANNDITAAKFYESSDERLKHNIVKLTNSSPAIYSFVKDVNNLNTYGFVAQNVELTNPDLVSYNREYKTVDYNGTMALLLSQALNRIEKLEAEVKELKTKIK